MLIGALQRPSCYEHPVDHFELLETHISWVILTGSYAYKIKKPVDFGFVDFTSLAKRRHYCYEELRLNKRLAADLYCDVVTINGPNKNPKINGAGEVLDYAVRMRQFDQQDLLINVASRNQLSSQHCDTLADIIAEFHQGAMVADKDSPFGTSDQISHWAQQNFQQIAPLLQNDQQQQQLQRLQDWTAQSQQRLSKHFQQRKEQGYIRECHGDLHLGNIALINDQVTVFDCIEFNDELRWIDVMSEIAFLVMDLYDHGYPYLARRFLDHYLMRTGHYQGLAVLTFYLIYRALVRAKIDRLRLGQSTLAAAQVQHMLREYQHYIDLALQFSQPAEPTLFITHGLAGSGKSTLAAKLVEELGAIRIRSDVERKRLVGLQASARSHSELSAGIYTQEMTEQTYQRLADCTKQILNAGYSVIADAAFLQYWQRDQFRVLAQRLEVKFTILSIQTPLAVLQERIKTRGQNGQDASEADLNVLNAQLKQQQALTVEEQAMTLVINGVDKEKSDQALRSLLHYVT